MTKLNESLDNLIRLSIDHNRNDAAQRESDRAVEAHRDLLRPSPSLEEAPPSYTVDDSFDPQFVVMSKGGDVDYEKMPPEQSSYVEYVIQDPKTKRFWTGATWMDDYAFAFHYNHPKYAQDDLPYLLQQWGIAAEVVMVIERPQPLPSTIREVLGPVAQKFYNKFVGASGGYLRTDEAQSLMQRAIDNVRRREGDDSANALEMELTFISGMGQFESIEEAVDNDAATELRLFIDNDGDLYRQQTTPIINNIKRKMKSGKYDHNLAPKLWMYLVDNGAKKYAKEFSVGSDWNQIFSKATRKVVAQEMADDYRDMIQGGEYGDINEALDYAGGVIEERTFGDLVKEKVVLLRKNIKRGMGLTFKWSVISPQGSAQKIGDHVVNTQFGDLVVWLRKFEWGGTDDQNTIVNYVRNASGVKPQTVGADIVVIPKQAVDAVIQALGLPVPTMESTQEALEEDRGLMQAIRAGDKVTIVDRFGQERTGRATMRGPHGWVLNMGGRSGTPAITNDDNITKVKPAKGRKGDTPTGALIRDIFGGKSGNRNTGGCAKDGPGKGQGGGRGGGDFRRTGEQGKKIAEILRRLDPKQSQNRGCDYEVMFADGSRGCVSRDYIENYGDIDPRQQDLPFESVTPTGAEAYDAPLSEASFNKTLQAVEDVEALLPELYAAVDELQRINAEYDINVMDKRIEQIKLDHGLDIRNPFNMLPPEVQDATNAATTAWLDEGNAARVVARDARDEIDDKITSILAAVPESGLDSKYSSFYSKFKSMNHYDLLGSDQRARIDEFLATLHLRGHMRRMTTKIRKAPKAPTVDFRPGDFMVDPKSSGSLWKVLKVTGKRQDITAKHVLSGETKKFPGIRKAGANAYQLVNPTAAKSILAMAKSIDLASGNVRDYFESTINEAWDAAGVQGLADGYGMNSPVGKIYIERAGGGNLRLKIQGDVGIRGHVVSAGMENPDVDFVGTPEEVVSKMNQLLGMRESITEAAQGFNVFRTPLSEARVYSEQTMAQAGMNLDTTIPDFDPNYMTMQGKKKFVKNIPRVLMPVIEPSDIKAFEASLAKGHIDIFRPEAMTQLQSKFPDRFTSRAEAAEWLTLGVKDGDLNDDVIKARITRVEASKLKPLQDEIWLTNIIPNIIKFGVAQQGSPVTEATLIVSQDLYIIDGHHRTAQAWLGDPSLKMKVLMVPLNIDELLEVARSYGAALGNAPKEAIQPKGDPRFMTDREREYFGITEDTALMEYDEDDPEIAPYLNSVYTVNVTYEEITWVDNEDPDGYEEDRGFEEQNETYDFEEMVWKIERDGFYEFSSSKPRKASDIWDGDWLSTGSETIDYKTGTTRRESLHIEAVDGRKPASNEAVWAVYKAAGLVK